MRITTAHAVAMAIAAASTTSFAAVADNVANDTAKASEQVSDEASAPHSISIPPGDLTEALKSFAKQTGRDLVYRPEQVAGLKTEGVSGELMTTEAIERLLKGSKLRANTDASTGAILIATPLSIATKPAAQGSANLEKTRWRLAQADPGGAMNTLPVAERSASSSDTAGLEEIIVTAQKREERLQDVPISISVLTGKELDRSAAKGLVEVLNLVPGVFAKSGNQSGASEISIRGLVPGAGSSTVGYYLDSVPFAFVRYIRLPEANIYDLERVEVLRGPQGTLYGVNAQNGVVRVLTHDASLDGYEAKARVIASQTDGGGDNFRGDAAMNIPIIDGKLAARAAVGYEDFGGWVERTNAEDFNDGSSSNARLKVNAQPTDNLAIRASVWRSKLDRDGASASDGAFRRNVSVDEPLEVVYNVKGLDLDYDFGAFTLSSHTSHIDYKTDGILRSQLSTTLYRTLQTSEIFAEEVNLSSSSEGRFRWSAGAFYRNAEDRVRQGTSAPPQGTSVPPSIALNALDWSDSSESFAVFGEVGYRILEKLELVVGLRYFYDDVAFVDNFAIASPYRPSDSFDAVTPRLVLTWRPGGELTAYASYSEGFRSGVMQTTAARQFAPLRPDRLENYELGLKRIFLDGRATLDSALYYMNYKDAQQSLGVPYLGSFTGALVNAQSASGLGFEAAAKLQPVDGLAVGLSFSWNDLTLDGDVLSNNIVLLRKGERLNDSAKYTYGGFASYTLPIGALEGTLSASANYQSERLSRSILGTGVAITEGEPLLYSNAKFSIGPVGQKWLISAFVDNLSNEDRVITPGSPSLFVDNSPRPQPRTIGVQFDVRF